MQPSTITHEEWQKLVEEANEVAGDRFNPDWAVAHVPDFDGRYPWLWYVTLPFGSLTDDQVAFEAHEGAARTRKAATRHIGRLVAEYDGRTLGQDPHGYTLSRLHAVLLVLASGLLLATALVQYGVPLASVQWAAAGLIVVALVLGRVRHRRALAYQPVTPPR